MEAPFLIDSIKAIYNTITVSFFRLITILLLLNLFTVFSADLVANVFFSLNQFLPKSIHSYFSTISIHPENIFDLFNLFLLTQFIFLIYSLPSLGNKFTFPRTNQIADMFLDCISITSIVILVGNLFSQTKFYPIGIFDYLNYISNGFSVINFLSLFMYLINLFFILCLIFNYFAD